MFENELAETLSLNGLWDIEIAGVRGSVQVPGAWEAQGYPFSAGVNDPVIYRRTFDVPQEWADADIYLQFDAVSYYAEVLINGVSVAAHEGLWTVFSANVTRAIRVGETNQLEVRVIKPGRKGNRFPYRDVLVGFLPYVFDTFGGIWQDVTLAAYRAPSFQSVTIIPHLENGQLGIQAPIRKHDFSDDADFDFVATVTDKHGEIVAETRQKIVGNNYAALTIEQPEAWSPESPALYDLTLQLEQAGKVVARTTRRFGFRKLEAASEHLLFNGESIHLRGILSWGWDPKTLAPRPTDEQVRDEFRRVRELGFNMVKLCLFVPTENVFRIADEEGMLLWLELPLWLPHLTDHLRVQARAEYANIMRQVHYHPSVVIYSLGCELGANMADAALLDDLNEVVRSRTHGALVCDNSGSGEAYKGLNFDYADFNDYHFYADLHYFVPLLDLFHRDWRPARPLIFGEFCDCDDYRDPADLLEDGQRPNWRDYLGVEGNLKRWAYSEQEKQMSANALPFSDTQIQDISRKQSLVVRKTILERTRLRRDIGGYVLTGLRDTPMSTSGVFDDNGRSKYSAEEFRRFNADAVLLLESGRSRRWTNGGDRPDPLDLFNHVSGDRVSLRAVLANSGQPLRHACFAWRLSDENHSVIGDGESVIDAFLPPGMPRELARVEFALPQVDQPMICRLSFTLTSDESTLQNSWPLWIYPAVRLEDAALYDPAGALDGFEPLARVTAPVAGRVIVAGGYSRETAEFVRAGGQAVVLQYGSGVLPVERVPFWRESIKVLCDHPVLNAFPHEGFADMQFYALATDAAFDLAGVEQVIEGGEVRPILRRLDARLFTMLEYLAEVRLGAGQMLISTLRFQGGLGDQVGSLRANPAGAFLLRQMVDTLLTR